MVVTDGAGALEVLRDKGGGAGGGNAKCPRAVPSPKNPWTSWDFYESLSMGRVGYPIGKG